ncbi:hypothetical protein COCSADRAFT_41922 [Bipolaris sorokiniana ND90Pr]|uniref:Uncharacterized protein n=1 Tax=Cochliobolus sativus (strain ND90Pr / ATCC 201652) TaxID=665912 RepID=M2SNV7_COCSN|nr:uncharacterized protein COCSADRAFT_41922 [Bipolaris sorokiniana ND90Pr]EMD58452.1 hypothetical protein COCSADRAFT_41922 [Bipolaris sorokiniana ND90Pr]
MQNEQDITIGLHKPMPNLEPSNAPPRPPTQLNATNNLLQRNLDQIATRLKDAKGVREELQEMKALFLRTAQGQATPNAQTPNLTPSIEKFGKARLPNIRIFKKGSHEEYTQIAQRKKEGSCLRCSIYGHLVRQCKAAVPKRTRKPETVTKVLAATLEDESSDKGKEEP